MQANQLLRVYFPGVLMSDTVISIGGGAYPAIPLVADMPSINPQFYVELDFDGNPILCAVKTNKLQLMGKFTGAGNVPAIPLPEYLVFGGHPVHHPHVCE